MTDLGRIDRGLHRVVHEIRQQELRSQRDHLDDVAVGPLGVLRASDTLLRVSMKAFANATAACRSGRLNGPAGSARSPPGGFAKFVET